MTDFLTGRAEADPDVEDLRAAGLVGNAFPRLSRHARRDELREGFLFTAARHVAIRRRIAALLAPWNDAGIVPLVFKGFHLAEFVYPAPGYRSYADVDLVVEETMVLAACEVAAAQGWDVSWHVGEADDVRTFHGPEYRGHEAAHLTWPELDVMVDLHRRVVHNVHNTLPAMPVTYRLTDAALSASETIEWEGARLRTLRPVDAVVFGLALNRCWGSDGWHVKPRDYVDFEALIERYGMTQDAVLKRATELGVARTVAIYLDRCDPLRRHLDTDPPKFWRVAAWNLEASRERGPIATRRARADLAGFASDAVALGRAIPVVADTWRRVRRDPRWTPDAPPLRSSPTDRPVGSQAWRRVRRAVHRAMRVLRVAEDRRDRVAAIAALRILRSRGVAVSLATAPANDASGASGPCLLYGGMPLHARLDAHEQD